MVATGNLASARPLDLASFKLAFDPVLADAISRRLHSCAALHRDSAVQDFIRYGAEIALAGGKRVRPYVGYLAYAASGGSDDAAALRALVSLELFHLFALIHDDWMDGGETRHGVVCLHRYAARQLAEAGADAAERVGASQAILVGDMVFGWSAQTLLQHVPAPQLQAALTSFYAMADEVVVGQMLDVDTVARERVSSEAVARKTELKTARYSFVHPLAIGAALAGVQGLSWAEALGTPLGIAFQLQDDLLDIVGSSSQTGKGTLADLREGQRTFFTQYIADAGTDSQRSQLNALRGRELSAAEAAAAAQLFQDSGALDAGREEISRLLAKARAAAEAAPHQPEYRRLWLDLISILEQRIS